MQSWRYRSRAWEKKAWRRWLGWGQRCRLASVPGTAGTVTRQHWRILNAIVLELHDWHAEIMADVSSASGIGLAASATESSYTTRSNSTFGLRLYPEGTRAR